MSDVGKIIETLVIGQALELGAESIHIEPRGTKINVRLRIDGILRSADSFPAIIYSDILGELKTLAGLNSRENRLPQHGNFRVVIDGKRYNFHVETIPTSAGEKVVLRLSQLNARAPSLKELGFWGDNLARISDLLRVKRGLILLTGPDDAGKATTIFTLLSMLNNEKINISTVETSIDHRIPGANQTAINPHAGLTIATGLASIARSDSEIIMASSIPDGASARTLVDAALSGHLAISSINAQSGGEATSRLAHMNIEPFLIASCVRSIISTRLVRQLCTKCRESYSPTKAEQESINHAFSLAKSSYKALAKLEAIMTKEQIGIRDKASSLGANGITRLWHAKGCKACANTGYSGRIGLYEIMLNSPTIERLILGRADSQLINKQSVREGATSLRTDGLIKALRGVTTIEEVIRGVDA